MDSRKSRAPKQKCENNPMHSRSFVEFTRFFTLPWRSGTSGGILHAASAPYAPSPCHPPTGRFYCAWGCFRENAFGGPAMTGKQAEGRESI